MRRSNVLLSLALALSTLVGCGSGRSSSSYTYGASATPEPSRPFWLVGTVSQTRIDEIGDMYVTTYTLEEDGTGTLHNDKITDDPMFDKSNSSGIYAWSATDDKLTINGVSRSLAATPNCRIVTLDDKVYDIVSDYECPFENPPFTEIEAKLVGRWKSTSDSDVTLQLDQDRHMVFTPGRATNSVMGYWTVDDEGVLRAVLPDGTEVMSANSTLASNGLALCDESGCLKMRR